ncbi:MAG: ATP-binding protein [Myxococcales bacterium]|nr:ATP-binding protein [Myxococcales bacterium]
MSERAPETGASGPGPEARAADRPRRFRESLRGSLHSMAEALLPREVVAGAGAQDRPSERTQRSVARWIVSLRWLAVLALGATFTATTIGHVYVGRVLPLWLGLIMLLGLNLVLTFAPQDRVSSARILGAQIAMDLLIIGWLLHHAGGVSNPLAALATFHIIIAAVALPRQQAERLIAGATVGVTVLTTVEASGLAPPSCMPWFQSVCEEPSTHQIVGGGTAVAALMGVCGLFVAVLVGALRRERDALRRTREALATEREKLASILECMADVVIFADSTGRIRLLNDAALAFWPAGPPDSSSLRVCHSEAAWELLLEKMANPLPSEEHPILVIGGQSFEATYAPVRSGLGEQLGVVMVARDITDRLAQQQWRMREERMAVVGKMAAALAHELNNPIGAIALFTQHALKSTAEGTPLTKHLQTILRNANQCSKIVRDLLTYARQRPPSRQEIVLEELLGDAERTIELHAQRSGVRLRRELEEGLLPLFGDPDQLRQVLVNLGLNAVEAMPEGGEIVFCARAEGQEILLEVVDDGPGIGVEAREHIFTAFHTTKAEGTGLGLAVAHDIVDAHGGSLHVETELGRGSTFRVRLPANAAATSRATARPRSEERTKGALG